jgi:hypothetical protein
MINIPMTLIFDIFIDMLLLLECVILINKIKLNTTATINTTLRAKYLTQEKFQIAVETKTSEIKFIVGGAPIFLIQRTNHNNEKYG